MQTIGTVLMAVGGIAMLVFGIMILIQAFKKSVGWGLASLFIPFVIFIFVFMNWEMCKTNFLRWLMALAVYAVGMVMGGASMMQGL